jgi:eukaryotic-like serine/threonine-protein kinase
VAVDPQRAQAVFLLAVEADAAARASVLERECENDTELRQRVELLLQAHGRSLSLLDQPPPQLQTSHGEPQLTEEPGLRIDPYKLFQQTGGATKESLAQRARVAGSGYDEELRRLLRSRLILVHLGAFAFILLLTVRSFLEPRLEDDMSLRPDQGNPWLLMPPLAVSLIGGIVLWRSHVMSIRALRLAEFIVFATNATLCGMVRFAMLVSVADGTQTSSRVVVAFRGLASLQGFIGLILGYGVLIPNTLRRSLLVVAALTAVPFAIIPAAVAVNPALRAGYLLPLIVQCAVILTTPASVAVFAAARAAGLHRRAIEAERRAKQIGQYILRRKLGAGGMGEVWLAEHGLLKRPCAVKFIRPEIAAHPATAARFAREVQAVTGLTHANTVRVYDYGRAEDGSFFYVMEYLDGPTLEELTRRAGPLPPARVAYLLRQVCGALVEAHAAGLVHRDLKPGNVVVAALGGQRDVAKLLDFGLVHDLSGDADHRLTRTGTVLGTPTYMSPEQAAGESTVDARCDVYSLGAVAFFALTGRPPFQRKSLGQLLAAHRAEAPPPLTELRSEIPADLAAVVARCLAKAPNDRFQSAADLERALGQCRCAAEWSAERAAEWWQAQMGQGKLSGPNSSTASEVTRTTPEF